MTMTHPVTEEKLPLFWDEDSKCTMFRVVVKSNLTMFMAEELINALERAVQKLIAIHGEEHNEQTPDRITRRKRRSRTVLNQAAWKRLRGPSLSPVAELWPEPPALPC